MATTSTINHGDIHHQNTMTLHQISSLAGLNKSEGSKVLSYTMSSDSAEDLIFFHTQGNVMDFLLEGENGSSRESLANLLDEGLGTSLDGTDEISTSIHPTLGRNDSGVFSSDETTGNGNLSSQLVTTSSPNNNIMSPIVSTSSSPNSMVTTSSNSPCPTSTTTMTQGNGEESAGYMGGAQPNGNKKQHRPKNTSPSRQGPQRCAICGKTFSNASALTKHKLTHSDERKHSCTVCGKAFKRQDHLNGHMLTHRSKKPFECSAKGCGKSYCDARSLRRHIESRHGHEALATMTIAPTPDSPPPTVAPSDTNLNPSISTAISLPIIAPVLSVQSGGKKVSTSTAGAVSSSNNVITSITSNPLLCQSSSTSPDGGSLEEASCVSTSTNLLDPADLVSLVDSSSLLDPSGFGPMDVIEMDQVVGGLKLEFRNEPALLINKSDNNNSRVVFVSRSDAVPTSPNRTNNNLNILVNNNNNNNSLIVKSSPLLTMEEKLLDHGVLIPHLHHQNNQTPTAYQTSQSQSQLHQLLTQQALNANNNSSNFSCTNSSSSSDGGISVVTSTSSLTSSPDSTGSGDSNINKYQGGGSLNSWQNTNNEIEIAKGSSGVFGCLDGTGSNGNSDSPLCAQSPILSGACSPSSLKEQLELIHQIIQQTQEESSILAPPHPFTQSSISSPSVSSPSTIITASNISSLVINSNPKSAKSSPKKSKCSTASADSSSASNNGSSSGDEGGKPGNEDKPVECAICYRRFKNTPALNGHMRLHGGYFKKDTDGKKKEHSSKESNGTPLQTASISVRALIEEKIIQRRNTIINNTQAAAAAAVASAATDNKIASSNPSSQLPISTVVVLTGNLNQTVTSSSSSSSSSSIQASSKHQPTLLRNGIVSNSNNCENLLGFPSLGNCNSESQSRDGIVINRSNSTSSNSIHFGTTSSSDSNSSQTFSFEYGEDNTDYLLMEEEVFNKVSSICPDSFFSGIEESILSSVTTGSDSGSDQLPPDCWSWTSSACSTTSTTIGGVDSSRLSSLSLFNCTSSNEPSTTTSPTFSIGAMGPLSSITTRIKTEPGSSPLHNETLFTPLPPLDAVFYTSPGGCSGGRTSSHSPLGLQQQDSPSFIYPTPPASLESHTALQSPLFPFPTPPPPPPHQTQNSSGLFPFETGNNNSNNNNNNNNNSTSSCNVVLGNTLITTCSNVLNGTNVVTTAKDIKTEGVPIPLCLGSSPNIITTCSSSNPGISSIGSAGLGSNNNNSTGMSLSTVAFNTSAALSHSSEMMVLTSNGVQMGSNSLSSSLSCGGATSTTTPIIINGIKPFHLMQGGNIALVKGRRGSICGDLNTPSPSNSPSLVGSTTSSNSSLEDSVQSLKELKVNEPSRMDLGEEELFRSPNRIQNSPPVQAMKLSKRKQLRNTFASNLRPQTFSSSSHFTPYPILSPVRSAPGLYWTFSTRLSHVEESKKELPRINVGANFQAILPPLREKRNVMSNYPEKEFEDNLWNPRVMDLCSSEEVDKYLEFACCSAIPGGGRNKEYALHILSLCHGDINGAMLLLMNPEPKLPVHLNRYKYPEISQWSRKEISSFQESILRHGKDFSQVSKEIGSKSREECVMFYQLWKKVSPNEYERVRTVWKKREAAFTIELLKNIPPPISFRSSNIKSATLNRFHSMDVDIMDFVPVVIKQEKMTNTKVSKALPSPANSQVDEEFPCKVCGKIFSKVKSRSAHMKSHRPPESFDNNNTKKNNKSSNPRPSPLSAKPVLCHPNSNQSPMNNKTKPKPILSSLPPSPPDSSSQPGSAESCSSSSTGSLKET